MLICSDVLLDCLFIKISGFLLNRFHNKFMSSVARERFSAPAPAPGSDLLPQLRLRAPLSQNPAPAPAPGSKPFVELQLRSGAALESAPVGVIENEFYCNFSVNF
jgi:hypothetical protein